LLLSHNLSHDKFGDHLSNLGKFECYYSLMFEMRNLFLVCGTMCKCN